jgi:type I restriction enzyme, S subunit
MAELRKTTMGHITKDHLIESRISAPPMSLIKQLDQKLSPIFHRILLNHKQNQELSKLRDWLLPMLINGQLTVAANYGQGDEVLSKTVQLNSVHKKIEKLNIPKNKASFAKQVLAGRIVSLFKDDKHFTHIKFQKLQFLAEHIGEADLNLNYYFQSAGPYDNRFMHTIADSFRKSKWFDERKYKFIPLEKQAEIYTYYKQYFSPISNHLNKLFKLLGDATDSEAEIIATIYAVWNNRILLKQPITESLLIKDFYNWSSRKHQYTQKQISENLQWLRQNDFAPKGFGKEIKRAKRK